MIYGSWTVFCLSYDVLYELYNVFYMGLWAMQGVFCVVEYVYAPGDVLFES